VTLWSKRKSESGGEEETPQDSLLESLHYVVLDTELTSLEHRTNRLLSIGAISMQGASIRLGEQFYRMVNPEVEIPAESVVIHQIRSDDVKGAESISKILDELSHFIRGAVLVGHFAHIDLKILRKEMTQTGHTLRNPAIDTARVHHWLLRQGRYSEDLALQLEKLDLETVAKAYGLNPENAHHALADAFLTAQVWQKMVVMLQSKGIRNLKNLLKIGATK
jgi:DNA polymerase-3 subunit epsilon